MRFTCCCSLLGSCAVQELQLGNCETYRKGSYWLDNETKRRCDLAGLGQKRRRKPSGKVFWRVRIGHTSLGDLGAEKGLLSQPFLTMSSPSFSMNNSRSPVLKPNLRLASAGTVTCPLVLSFADPSVFISFHLLCWSVREALNILLLTILTSKK